jgi:hypothetical protein
MDEDNPIEEISQIEARLEELAEVSERCRTIILVSKATIAGGVALLLVMMRGLFGSNQVAAIGSIAVVLGGIVSLAEPYQLDRIAVASFRGIAEERYQLVFGDKAHLASREIIRSLVEKSAQRRWH